MPSSMYPLTHRVVTFVARLTMVLHNSIYSCYSYYQYNT
jgi:hypothetical protein